MVWVSITIAAYMSWFLFGKDKDWIGGVAVWICAMYVAMKKTN